jgi:hypothetical protein
VTSYCHKTFANASHNTGVNPDNWSCFYGLKQDSLGEAKKFHQQLLTSQSYEL